MRKDRVNNEIVLANRFLCVFSVDAKDASKENEGPLELTVCWHTKYVGDNTRDGLLRRRTPAPVVATSRAHIPVGRAGRRSLRSFDGSKERQEITVLELMRWEFVIVWPTHGKPHTPAFQSDQVGHFGGSRFVERRRTEKTRAARTHDEEFL